MFLLIIMINIWCPLPCTGDCWCLFMAAPPLCTLTVVISSGLCKGESLQFPLFTPVEFVVRISSFVDEKFKHDVPRFSASCSLCVNS